MYQTFSIQIADQSDMAHPYLKILESITAEQTKRSSSELDLSCRHFFSGAALYANGTICASLTPKGFAFKLPPHRADELILAKQAEPMRYFDRSPVKKGYVLLADYETRGDEVTSLFNECLQFAATVP